MDIRSRGRMLGIAICCFGWLVGHAGAAFGEIEVSHLHARLGDLNRGWLEIEPDFAVLPADWKVDSETELIQTHFALVIDRLRRADVSHLTETQQANRQQNIERLARYSERGRFPLNTYVAERRPVFIDVLGTHCAVGQLMADSGHAALASRVNSEHRLDYLCDIRTEGVAGWQLQSGLSIAELALIQPGYHSWELRYPEMVEDVLAGKTEKVLRDLGDNPQFVSARCGGKTLLHYAAAAGDLKVCQYLVEHGADMQAKTEVAWTSKRPKPRPGDFGPMSSSTKVIVKWNQPAELTEGGGGVGQIGRKGPSLQSPTSILIVGALGDLSGGVEGKTAFELCSEGIGDQPNRGPEMNEKIRRLQANRAAVATWLASKGAK